MRLTVVALGTRGDVQPLIALSQGLQAAGHQVAVIAGSNFADWVAGHGLPFTPTLDMEAVMNSEQGLAWSESSRNPMQQLRLMRELLAEHGEDLYLPILASADATDLFVGGFTSEPFVESISQKTGVPYVNALLQPHQPTRSGPASLNPILPRRSSLLNRWMGDLAQRLLWSVARESTNRLRTQRLGLPPHTAASYLAARRRAPTVFGFSRHVVPPAPDWPDNARVTGYWFLDDAAGAAAGWQPPPPQVSAFLEAGAPPVYIGFGSMSNSEPQKTLALILEAATRSGVRAIIGAGWSGLRAGTLPDSVMAVGSVPHHWLFPRTAAVVHHGGAGTTAAGLRAGVPALIVPHMSDQPFWGRRVHELGAGVRPVPRHKLTAETLAAGLKQLVGDASLHARAQALSEKIRVENGVACAVQAISAWTTS